MCKQGTASLCHIFLPKTAFDSCSHRAGLVGVFIFSLGIEISTMTLMVHEELINFLKYSINITMGTSFVITLWSCSLFNFVASSVMASAAVPGSVWGVRYQPWHGQGGTI